MSKNILPLEVIQSYDPLIDISSLDKRMYEIYNGGSVISYQQYIAQNVNNSSIQVTTLPPSDATIIDPKVYAQVEYTMSFVGATGTGNLIQVGSYDAPRAFPLSQTTTTLAATINGQSITTLLNQYVDAACRYNGTLYEVDKEFGTPTQLDQCTDYANLVNTNRSPFVLFGENTFQRSRGAFSGIEIVSNTPTSAVVKLKVYEPLILPGFYFNRRGLINVRTLNWLFTFGDLNRVWSHDSVNGNNITSMTTNITAFSLWYKFITPKIIEKIPKQVVYNYNEIVPSNQNYGSSVSAGQQITISMSALNLQAIPKALLIYVKKPITELTYTDADSYFRIDNISVNFQNVTGLLASAPTQALYQICNENGYVGSWDEYNKYNGSVLMLKMGKDIGLSANEAPGLLKYPQLSLVVKATNIGNNASNAMLYVQVIYEGCITISDGQMNKSVSVISDSDVLNAQLKDAKVVEYHKHDRNFYGGDLLSSITNFAKDIVQTAKSGAELGMNVAPYLGAGVSGGKKHKKRGGDLIDRNQLMEMAEDY